MGHRLLRALVVTGALLGAPPPATADVIVVDPTGFPSQTVYHEIGDAVNAASNGDVVLVMPGNYDDPVTITDKSLTIQCEGLHLLRNSFTVQGLSASRSVTVRGLRISGTPGDALVVDGCLGPVRVEDGSFKTSIQDGNAAAVRFSDAVVFSRCTFTGSDGGDSYDDGVMEYPPTAAGGGAFLRHSDVAFFDCTLTGGDGGDDVESEGFAGGGRGPGLEAVGGTVWIVGGTLQGGGGGRGGCKFGGVYGWEYCASGGWGGHGLLARGDAAVTTHDAQLAGGAPGAGGTCPCPFSGDDGLPGQDLVLQDVATAGAIPGAARHFEASSPVREGQSVTLTFAGEPGDVVSVWGSLAAGWFPLPEYQGVFTLGFPLVQPFGIPLGVADANGDLVLAVPVLELGAGLQGFAAHLQVTFVGLGASTIGLGPTSTPVLLDAYF